MHVTLHEWNDADEDKVRLVGRARLLDGKVVAEGMTTPTDAHIMSNLLKDEIGWYSKGFPLQPITAQSHPKEFLENLHREYHGSLFWASKVMDDETDLDSEQPQEDE